MVFDAPTIFSPPMNTVGSDVTPAALAQLMRHDWPGNVRELRNVLCRAADLTTAGRWIDANSVMRALHRTPSAMPPLSLTPENAKDWLVTHGGNVSAAARAAKIPRSTFRKLLARAGTTTSPG